MGEEINLGNKDMRNWGWRIEKMLECCPNDVSYLDQQLLNAVQWGSDKMFGKETCIFNNYDLFAMRLVFKQKFNVNVFNVSDARDVRPVM